MMKPAGDQLSTVPWCIGENHRRPDRHAGCLRATLTSVLLLMAGGSVLRAADWPALPPKDGAVEIPVQEWPRRPGPRHVRVVVHYPDGTLSSVQAGTGLMLTLHNWGGVDCVGTANPQVLARNFNVVALCVNYLQSGPKDSIEGSEPYDFGYLQALDALRALWWVRAQLIESKLPFADGRIYTTGGSGGGNVSLMANKLAPRTFACVIDMCGMKKLSDEIAYNLPGNGGLNARWSRDPDSPNYLSPDEQQLRCVGDLMHLAEMKRLGAAARILVIHGVDDAATYPHARELVRHLELTGLAVEPHFITKDRVDGQTFTTTGHALGNRTRIVVEVAGKYLDPNSPDTLVRKGPTDFERGETLKYETPNGAFEISYADGFPVGSFRSEMIPRTRRLSNRLRSGFGPERV